MNEWSRIRVIKSGRYRYAKISDGRAKECTIILVWLQVKSINIYVYIVLYPSRASPLLVRNLAFPTARTCHITLVNAPVYINGGDFGIELPTTTLHKSRPVTDRKISSVSYKRSGRRGCVQDAMVSARSWSCAGQGMKQNVRCTEPPMVRRRAFSRIPEEIYGQPFTRIVVIPRASRRNCGNQRE